VSCSLYCSLLEDATDEEDSRQEAISKSLIDYNREMEGRYVLTLHLRVIIMTVVFPVRRGDQTEYMYLN